MSDKGNIAELSAALQPHGMVVRGGFALTDEDEQGLAGFPDLASPKRRRFLLLIGNAGRPLYDAFFSVDQPAGRNPLDDWTKRIVRPVARRLGARVAFPSDGPPYLPFQRWAMRAEGVKPSPLGVLIHPEFGLWHAYRAALVFDQALDAPSAPIGQHPCDACTDKPCLTACPAEAVSAAAYAVDKCAPHVASGAGKTCRSTGCLARRACPVGADLAYPDRAMAFHMASFLRGQGLSISHPEDSESVY